MFLRLDTCKAVIGTQVRIRMAHASTVAQVTFLSFPFLPSQFGLIICFRLHAVGTIHDHVINFKVDLDVVNEKNSLLEKTTHVREVTHPWLDEGDWGTTIRQQFIKSRYIETENESRLFYPPNFRGLFAFVNKEETNSWGVPRGYLIHPGYSPIYNVCIGIISLLSLWLL